MATNEASEVTLLAVADARRTMEPRDRAAWAALYSRLQTLVADLTDDDDGGGFALASDLDGDTTALLETVQEVATTWCARASERTQADDDELRALETAVDCVGRRVRAEWRPLGSSRAGDAGNEDDGIAERLGSDSDQEKALALAQLWEVVSIRCGRIGICPSVDVIPPLVLIVRGGTADQKEAATLVLWALARQRRNIRALVEADVAQALVVLVETGDDAQKPFAVWTLWTLVAEMEASKIVIPLFDGLVLFASLAHTSTLVPLIKLLREGSDTQAYRTLWALSTIAASRDEAVNTAMVDAGAIELVVNTLSRKTDGAHELLALRVLYALAATENHRTAMAEAHAIKPLVTLFGNDPATRRLALKVLRRLADDDTDAIHHEIREAGAVAQLVKMARENGDAERIEAVKILAVLAAVQASRVAMLEAGALSVVEGTLRTDVGGCKALALFFVLRIASDNAGFCALADSDVIERVVDRLENGSRTQQEIAASALERLMSHPLSRAKALSACLLSPLVERMRTGSQYLQLTAAQAIRVVVEQEPSQHRELMRVGGIQACVALSRSGTDAQQTLAVATLLRLSSNVEVKQEILRVDPTVFTHTRVVNALVELLRIDSGDSLKALAAEALSQAVTEATEAQIPVARAIEPLVDFACGDHGHIEVALRALYQITRLDTNCRVADDEPIGPYVARLWNDAMLPQPVRVDTTAPPVSPRCLRSLVTLLHGDDPKLIEYVVGALVNLSLHEGNKAMIAQANSLSPLLAFVQGGTGLEKILALSLLRNLATGENAAKSAMYQAGAVDALVGVLHSDFHERKQMAVVALWNLADNRDAIKRAIADAGAIPFLVALLRQGTRRQKEVAAGALWGLALASRNKSVIVDAGAIVPLVALVSEGTDSQKLNAAGALCSLAAGHDAMKHAIEQADGIAPLVVLARQGSTAQRRYATWALQVAGNRHEEATARRNVQLAVATVVVAGVAWVAMKH